MSKVESNKRLIWFAIVVFIIAGAGIGYAAVPQSTTRTTGAGITTYVGHNVNATVEYYRGAQNYTAWLLAKSGVAAIPFDQDLNTTDNVSFASVNATDEFYRNGSNYTAQIEALIAAGGGGSANFNLSTGATAYVGYDSERTSQTNYWLVDGTADNIQIQAAIDYVKALETPKGSVCLEQGTYNTIAEIEIGGMSDFRLYSNGVANIDKTGSFHGINIHNSDNIFVNGFNLSTTDGYRNHYSLVLVEGSSDVWINKNLLQGSYFGVNVRANQTTYTKSIRVHVNDNEIYNFTYCGIQFGNGCDSVEADNNYIHDGWSHDGVYLYGIATQTIGEQHTTNPMVEYLSLSNNRITNLNFADGNGMDIHGGNYITVTENQLSNIPNMGIFVHLVAEGEFDAPLNHDWDVSHNILVNCTEGIRIETADDAEVLEDVSVTDNEVTGFTDNAIIVAVNNAANTVMRNVEVSHNTITNSTGSVYGSGIIVYVPGASAGVCENVVIEGNIVDGSTGGANKMGTMIQVSYFNNVKISNNVVSDFYADSGGQGITIEVSENAQISNNIVADGYILIRTIGCTGTMITNNRLDGSPNPIYSPAGNTRIMIVGNNWEGCAAQIDTGGSTTPRISANLNSTGEWFTGDNPE